MFYISASPVVIHVRLLVDRIYNHQVVESIPQMTNSELDTMQVNVSLHDVDDFNLNDRSAM